MRAVTRHDCPLQYVVVAAWYLHRAGVRALARRATRATLARHPLASELLAAGTPNAPQVYIACAAQQGPGLLLLYGVDKRPAIELCAEYLDRVTHLLDEAGDCG